MNVRLRMCKYCYLNLDAIYERFYGPVKFCAGQKQIALVNEVRSVTEESLPELHFASVSKRVLVKKKNPLI